MDTMSAIWLENQSLEFRDDVPIPKPMESEALVRVLVAGICSTDLELTRGYYPFTGIPGHEFVGKVIEAPGNRAWVGNRVVGEINIACGECENCQAGRVSHCSVRTVLGIQGWDGAFSEYLILPIENLHTVPDDIHNDAAVFTEPLAAALEIQQQVHVLPSDRVLMIGAGRLGQLISQTLALTGCDLLVVARHKIQHKILNERGIATVEEKYIPDHKMDIVIEATGSEQGFSLATNSVRPRGVVVLKSTFKGNVKLNLSSLVVDEITIIGSRCGPFTPALSLLQDKLVDPTPLIVEKFPLDNAIRAFERAAQTGVLKVLLYPKISN
jgi:threonine dehydrogenase-like Zn-dependent dehydrogenase